MPPRAPSCLLAGLLLAPLPATATYWQAVGPEPGIGGVIDVAVAADGGVYLIDAREGLSRSLDAGRQWTPLLPQPADERSFSVLAVSPTVATDLTVGLRSPPWSVEYPQESHAYRSTDRGAGWEALSITRSMASAVFDPWQPARIWFGSACTGPYDQRPVQLLLVDPPGVTVVRDGQDCFVPFHRWQIFESFARLAADHGSNVLYVVKQSDSGSPPANGRTLLRSSDGGQQWQAVNDNLPFAITPVRPREEGLIDEIAVDSTTGGVYVTTTTGRVYHSLDGTGDWRDISAGLPPDTPIGALAVDSSTVPATLYLASHGTIHTRRGDSAWESRSSGLPGTRITALAVDPRGNGAVYAATAGSGLYVLNQPLDGDWRDLMNISTRSQVGTGEQALKAGFIVQREGVRVLVKGEGPVLGTGALTDPLLVLRRLDGVPVYHNDDWRDDPSAHEVAALAPPRFWSESAFVIDLVPGAYIANLEGKSGSTGLGLVSVTEVAAFNAARSGVTTPAAGLMNVSTRGLVGHDRRELKAGFIVQGSPVRVLIKGEGPVLGAGSLADPALALTTLAGEPLHDNDDWRDDPSAGEVADLAPPLSERAAAFVVELAPGAYIASLRGAGAGGGLGLVSVSDVRAFR